MPAPEAPLPADIAERIAWLEARGGVLGGPQWRPREILVTGEGEGTPAAWVWLYRWSDRGIAGEGASPEAALRDLLDQAEAAFEAGELP